MSERATLRTVRSWRIGSAHRGMAGLTGRAQPVDEGRDKTHAAFEAQHPAPTSFLMWISERFGVCKPEAQVAAPRLEALGIIYGCFCG